MKAYNETWVENLFQQDKLKDWFDNKLITESQYTLALKECESGFRKSDLIVKIALFFASILGSSFTIGLFSLILMGESSPLGFGFLAIVISIIFFIFIETIIKSDHHYRSGVDTGVIYMALGVLIVGINALFKFELPKTMICTISAIVLFIALIRYGNRFVALMFFLSFIGIIFFGVTNFNLGKIIIPFVLSIVGAGTYLFSKKTKIEAYYYDAQLIIEFLALTLTYLGVNYMVVREGNAMLNNLEKSIEIPFAAIFWMLSFIIPFLFLINGSKRKEKSSIILGILSFGFSVYTFRTYHSVLPIEWGLTIAGIFILLASIISIKYFNPPKHNISSIKNKNNDNGNLEAAIITEVMINNNNQKPDFKFGGGGGFGGGGSSESY